MATTTNPSTSLADQDRGPFVAPESELPGYKRAATALRQSQADPPRLVTSDGNEIELPSELLRVLRSCADLLAADRAVVLASFGELVDRFQAAELIGVRAQYVEQLIRDGDLPTIKKYGVDLLRRDDVLAFRHAFKARQRESLRALSRLSQELGLDDLDADPTRLKRLAEFDDNSDPA